VRWVSALSLLAGCDYIIGLDYHTPPVELESRTHDEDNDGIEDAFDLCPHLKVHSDADADKDSIGDDCDPHPATKDERYFFAFENGLDPTMRLTQLGLVMPAGADSIQVGQAQIARSALVLRDVQTDEAHVTFEGKIVNLGNLARDTDVGIFAVHRAFQDDPGMPGFNAERGDNCLVGRDDPPVTVPPTPQNFLERNSDASDLSEMRFPGFLEGTMGTFSLTRVPNTLGCGLQRSDTAFVLPPVEIPTNVIRTGAVAIGTEYMEVEVFYLWIVVPTRP
jgi:hypothetical protein